MTVHDTPDLPGPSGPPGPTALAASPAGSDGPTAPIDVEQARRLLDALERDLGGAAAGVPNVDVLRAEIQALRQVLHADEPAMDEMTSGLHGMRDRLHEFQDELKGDALQAGRYLAELGRILGL